VAAFWMPKRRGPGSTRAPRWSKLTPVTSTAGRPSPPASRGRRHHAADIAADLRLTAKKKPRVSPGPQQKTRWKTYFFFLAVFFLAVFFLAAFFLAILFSSVGSWPLTTNSQIDCYLELSGWQAAINFFSFFFRPSVPSPRIPFAEFSCMAENLKKQPKTRCFQDLFLTDPSCDPILRAA